MHILTKILVVLVALLVVALVPLAAVSSTNQLSFKDRAVEAETTLKSEQADKNAAKDAYNASVAALQAKIAGLEKSVAVVSQQRDGEISARNDAEKQLEGLRIQVAELQGQANSFAANDTLQTKLIDAMRQDIENSRTAYLAAEKARAELADAQARLQGELDAVTASNNLLKEQLQKAGEDKERAAAELQRMVAQHGASEPRAGAAADVKAPVVADRSLSATVVSVRREPDSTLAEINAGSRDGVKEGWVMTLADGANFIGNLRIVTVDVNRAVGVVELEDPQGRGEVKSGQRAIARKGE